MGFFKFQSFTGLLEESGGAFLAFVSIAALFKMDFTPAALYMIQ